jgi:hypothetical protein
MTSLAKLRRRKAQAVLALAAKERRHRGGVAKARADAIDATHALLRAELNHARAAPLLRAQAMRNDTPDLFQPGA